nr:hypothetical protein [Paenibacillus agricola]
MVSTTCRYIHLHQLRLYVAAIDLSPITIAGLRLASISRVIKSDRELAHINGSLTFILDIHEPSTIGAGTVGTDTNRGTTGCGSGAVLEGAVGQPPLG